MTGAAAGRLVLGEGNAVDRALNRATGSRAIPGNKTSLVTDGPAIFEAAHAIVASAREWIHFENYILRDDATGLRLAEHLTERARAGVRIRVMADWLGSIATHRTFWRALRSAGVEVRLFNPPRVMDLAGNLTRNHRKLVLADGGTALIGGFCFGDEWAGDPVRERLPWRETALQIRGPAAARLDHAFAKAWGTAGPPLPPAECVASVAPAGTATARVLAGEPGRLRAYRTTEFLVATAAYRIWITDAYFVAPRRIRDALWEAARDGVDVRILVPGSSDLPFIRNLTRFGYRDFLRHGVRIFEWGGPMLHAKTAVVDGHWVRVGSSNVNVSSLIGNWELDVLVEDADLAEEAEKQFRRDLDRSAEVTRRVVRGPLPIGRVLPSALTIQGPDTDIPRHVQGLRERGHRTVRALRAVAAGAQLSIFAPLGFAALGIAAMFLFLPRVTAGVFAVLSLWVAIASGLQVARGTDRA